ncbi:MAG: porin [Bacteroidetes bacterium]|nr:MAG: porin [Bacteroidota bacterium]
MNKLITELIGTFFLVLTIGLVVATGSPLAPLAIGSVLMVMVYMGGHISGAHYNPAVTLGVWMRGSIETGDVAKYMGVQLLGALLGAAISSYLTGETLTVAHSGNMIPALVAEFLFTFALVLVVLNVATSDATSGNSYFGLAIGFTVMVGAFAVGGISGGAFNPAVGIGAIIVDITMGNGSFGDGWIYLVGPFGGGAAAAMVYKVQNS